MEKSQNNTYDETPEVMITTRFENNSNPQTHYFLGFVLLITNWTINQTQIYQSKL